MLLFYIRHGDPIYSPDSLTPLGQRQAEAVAKRLATYGIDRIFASTSNRAIQTATPTSEIVKKEIELLDFCNEVYAWNDLTVVDENGKKRWIFQSQKLMRIILSRESRELGEKWYEHPDLKQYHFEKGIERVSRELDALLLSLGYEHDRDACVYKAVAPNDKRIALFAHQGFGIAFLSSLLDIPYPQICTHFDMGHTGITVFEFANNSDGIVIPKTLTLANDSHIYKEGLPTFYNNYIHF